MFFFPWLYRNPFEGLSCIVDVQIKAWEEKAPLTFRPTAQCLAVCAVIVCVWYVCVFGTELTKLWPWRSLCWITLQVECRNYIRTLHTINDTTIYVCGTYAFSPVCDYLVSVSIFFPFLFFIEIKKNVIKFQKVGFASFW